LSSYSTVYQNCSYATGWIVLDSNTGEGKRFSLLQTFQTGSGARPASYSIGTDVLSGG
jgi:hypothetical protein